MRQYLGMHKLIDFDMGIRLNILASFSAAIVTPTQMKSELFDLVMGN